MQNRFLKKKNGDTLIEVLLAISIFTAVVVGSHYTMSRGIGTSQRSLELTQVRAQIDNQADMLRHLSNKYYVSGGQTRAVKSASSSDLHPGKDGWSWILANTVTKVPEFNNIDFNGNYEACLPKQDVIGEGDPRDAQKAFFINDQGDVVKFLGNAAASDASIEGETGGYGYARISEIPDKKTVNTGVNGASYIAKNMDKDSDSYNGGYVSKMLWIYAQKKNDSAGRNKIAGDIIDFHIRACWNDPDRDGIQTLGTIVRIYTGK